MGDMKTFNNEVLNTTINNKFIILYTPESNKIIIVSTIPFNTIIQAVPIFHHPHFLGVALHLSIIRSNHHCCT